jgi:hypothetical protein
MALHTGRQGRAGKYTAQARRVQVRTEFLRCELLWTVSQSIVFSSEPIIYFAAAICRTYCVQFCGSILQDTGANAELAARGGALRSLRFARNNFATHPPSPIMT